MTNQQVRQWYLAEVRKIPLLNEDWIKEGIKAEERARRAWRIRRQARLRAREMMGNRQEVKLLQDRDLKLYGGTDGPTFEFLVARAVRLGLKGDNIYESIIADAYVTNVDVNRGLAD